MRRTTTRTLLTLAALLTTLSLTPSLSSAADKEGKEENEVKVKLTDVPAPVRATLDKESSGATLPDEIDKETEHGKTLYEADVKIAGKNYEIKVAEDGTLLSKELEEDDDHMAKKGGEGHGKTEKDKD